MITQARAKEIAFECFSAVFGDDQAKPREMHFSLGTECTEEAFREQITAIFECELRGDARTYTDDELKAM